jgi:predicted ribosome quality control (RQC) complex YloA/Tae2 family protein
MSEPWNTYRVESFDVLVGTSARANDRLSTREARPDDLWLHAAGYAGSHVLVRDPSGRTGDVPRSVVEEAARLAVKHSKARGAGGKVAVHVCRARDVRKRKGSPAGQVQIRSYETVKVYAPGPE